MLKYGVSLAILLAFVCSQSFGQTNETYLILNGTKLQEKSPTLFGFYSTGPFSISWTSSSNYVNFSLSTVTSMTNNFYSAIAFSDDQIMVALLIYELNDLSDFI